MPVWSSAAPILTLAFPASSLLERSKPLSTLIFQTMDSKSLGSCAFSTLVGAGLGGWFGVIYGANVAAVDVQRPRNPFQCALYISKTAARHGAVGAVALGATAYAFKAYETSKVLKTEQQ